MGKEEVVGAIRPKGFCAQGLFRLLRVGEGANAVDGEICRQGLWHRLRLGFGKAVGMEGACGEGL